MVFRFYTNQISQATRTIATGVLTVGMALIGLGVLILVLPAIFVAIAAGLFFVAGLTCALYAAKIFLAARRLNRTVRNGHAGFIDNDQVRDADFYDS